MEQEQSFQQRSTFQTFHIKIDILIIINKVIKIEEIEQMINPNTKATSARACAKQKIFVILSDLSSFDAGIVAK